MAPPEHRAPYPFGRSAMPDERIGRLDGASDRTHAATVAEEHIFV